MCYVLELCYIVYLKESQKIKMQFIFDEFKLSNNNLILDDVLNKLRDYFKSHNIKETAIGLFEGKDSDFGYFTLCVAKLPKASWFMDYIKEWYWFIDDGYEDVLKSID